MANAQKRAARLEAAQARDAAIVAQGERDPFLVDWLRGSRAKDPVAFERARRTTELAAARPSAPGHAQALVALGGFRALEAEDAERAARAQGAAAA